MTQEQEYRKLARDWNRLYWLSNNAETNEKRIEARGKMEDVAYRMNDLANRLNG